jgi:hypothetical protein
MNLTCQIQAESFNNIVGAKAQWCELPSKLSINICITCILSTVEYGGYMLFWIFLYFYSPWVCNFISHFICGSVSFMITYFAVSILFQILFVEWLFMNYLSYFLFRSAAAHGCGPNRFLLLEQISFLLSFIHIKIYKMNSLVSYDFLFQSSKLRS